MARMQTQIDSLRDSSKRMNRQSNGIAPHAKGESSPSPSYSDNSDLVSSIRKIEIASPKHSGGVGGSAGGTSSGFGGGGGSKPFRKHSNSNESDVYVIKNEFDSGNDERAGTCSRPETNNLDSVDCSALHSKYDHAQPNNVFKMDPPPPSKWNKNALHQQHQQTSHSNSTTSSSTTSKTIDDSTSAENQSLPTSPASLSTPIETDVAFRRMHPSNPMRSKCEASGFRTSRSEDHLQQHSQRDLIDSIVPIDVDEDVNSSLNTLLDTRDDSEGTQNSCDRERIVWTYNAPIVTSTTTNNTQSFSSSISSSPQHTDTPASPTSVSSSIMSSNSGSKDVGGQMSIGVGGGGGGGACNNHPAQQQQQQQNLICPANHCTDQSVSEAVSNISSPDYQDDENLLSTKDMCGIGISDFSDSDSTILVSDMTTQPDRKMLSSSSNRDHKVMIKVKGATVDASSNGVNGSDYKDSEDELATLMEDMPNNNHQNGTTNESSQHDSSPPISDDGSDVDSLHSYHYSPKAVDLPSAVRLAKRLFGLEGFKKSDVSRHLSKKYAFYHPCFYASSTFH